MENASHNRHRSIVAFSRAVEALEPYLGEIVIIGGWAHYLYTLRPEAGVIPFEPLLTGDADIAIPAFLRGHREGIATLLTKAGFSELFSGDQTPPFSEYVLKDEPGGFYLEFLVPLVGSEMKRAGRRDVTVEVAGVTAQKLRYLEVLFNNPWKVVLSRKDGFIVKKPLTILVPNLQAYIVQKVLALQKRTLGQQAKDLLYIHDSFAILSGSLEGSIDVWESMKKAIPENYVRKFEKAIESIIIDDHNILRRAANIASLRPSAPSAELILKGLRFGFAEVFGLIPPPRRR